MTSDSGAGPSVRLRIALVTDPGLPAELADHLAEHLPPLLREDVAPHVDWQVRTITMPLHADEQVDISGLVEDVLPGLTDRDWDAGVFVTDLPRRTEQDPVSAEVSKEHHVGLVSLPALGSARLRRRAARAVVEVIALLVAPDAASESNPVIGERVGAHKLPPQAKSERSSTDLYVVPGSYGHLRLVAGMVRDNRPWQLFTTLSRALAGVFATAAFGMINGTGWLVATGLDTWRHSLIAVLSVVALTLWIIIDHELWERHADDLSRARARLYNLVTVVTIALGVLFLYLVLFLVLLGVTGLLLVPSVLQQVLRAQPFADDYISLAWFVTSFGMLGGAFGSGLEDDGTVRNAAYGERQRSRREAQQRAKERREQEQRDAPASGDS